MNRLVGDMLELARGLGREAPQRHRRGGAAREMAAQAGEAGTRVEVFAESCVVSAAPVALRRLLDNLLAECTALWRRPAPWSCARPGGWRRAHWRAGPRPGYSRGPDRGGVPPVPSCRAFAKSRDWRGRAGPRHRPAAGTVERMGREPRESSGRRPGCLGRASGVAARILKRRLNRSAQIRTRSRRRLERGLRLVRQPPACPPRSSRRMGHIGEPAMKYTTHSQ